MTYRDFVATANGDDLSTKFRLSSGNIGCHAYKKDENECLQGKA